MAGYVYVPSGIFNDFCLNMNEKGNSVKVLSFGADGFYEVELIAGRVAAGSDKTTAVKPLFSVYRDDNAFHIVGSPDDVPSRVEFSGAKEDCRRYIDIANVKALKVVEE